MPKTRLSVFWEVPLGAPALGPAVFAFGTVAGPASCAHAQETASTYARKIHENLIGEAILV